MTTKLKSRIEGKEYVTPGVRKLRAHLTHVGVSVPVFCTRHGLTYHLVRKLVAGEMRTVDVDLAAAVENATRGADGCAVEIRDFVTPKSRAKRARAQGAPGAV